MQWGKMQSIWKRMRSWMPGGIRSSVMKVQHHHHSHTPNTLKWELPIGSSRCVVTGSLWQSDSGAWSGKSRTLKSPFFLQNWAMNVLVLTLEFYVKTFGCKWRFRETQMKPWELHVKIISYVNTLTSKSKWDNTEDKNQSFKFQYALGADKHCLISLLWGT